MDLKDGLNFNFKDKRSFEVKNLSKDDKVSGIVEELQDLQDRDLVRLGESDEVFNSQNQPYQMEIYQDETGEFKLRRIPIIFD